MKKFARLCGLVVGAVILLSSVVADAAITYSVTTKHRGNMGDQAIVIAQIDLTGTYVTNGFTLTPKDFGLSTINGVLIPDYSGYSYEWVRSTGKIKVYSAGADYTPTGTISTVGITITVGTGTVTDTAGFTAAGVFSSTTGGTITGVMDSVPIFTGIASATSSAEEVDNGTSLAGLNVIELVLMGR